MRHLTLETHETFTINDREYHAQHLDEPMIDPDGGLIEGPWMAWSPDVPWVWRTGDTANEAVARLVWRKPHPMDL